MSETHTNPWGILSDTLRKLEIAAYAKAGGKSWEAVAPLIGRSSADSARQLPSEHPAAWEHWYGVARKELRRECFSEAVTVLRKALRSDNPIIQVKAAAILLRHSDEEPLQMEVSGQISHRLTLDERREIDAILGRGRINAN